MPAGNGRTAKTTKWRSLDDLSAIKKYCHCKGDVLVFALCINYRIDSRCKSCRNGTGLKQPVEELINASGVNLTNCVRLTKLKQVRN